MTNELIIRRLAAFQARSKSGPLLKFHGFVIPINPMSDEEDLLRDLGLSPKDCIKFDCYWHAFGDVYFVQVHTTSYSQLRECGIYARLQDDASYFANVLVVVDDPFIGSKCVRDALERTTGAITSAPTFSKTLTRL